MQAWTTNLSMSVVSGSERCFANAAMWSRNSTALNSPGTEHKIVRRDLDERKEMSALVFSDLRNVSVRTYLYVSPLPQTVTTEPASGR